MRQEARVYVVHTGTPTFSIRNREREADATTAAAAGGPIGLAIAAAIVYTPDGSVEIARDARIERPMPQVRQRLVAALAAEPSLAGVQWIAADAAEPGAAGLTLDLERWGIESASSDGDAYAPVVKVKATLAKGADVLWTDSCDSSLDQRSVLVDLRHDPAQLRTMMARATDACADDLVARFLNRRPADPFEGEKQKVSFAGSRLSDVETVLGTPGGGGLVGGHRRFEAEFERLALATADVATVQAIIRDSMASPRDSEVRLRGTIDGQPFEAKMEKYGSGRVKVKFRGLRFASDQDVDAFLAPFADPIVKKIDFEGEVAGRPLDRSRSD